MYLNSLTLQNPKQGIKIVKHTMKSNRQLTKREKIIEELTQIILNNLENEQFGVNELSRQAGLSRSQLHRKVKAYTDKSLGQFIREIRLKEAYKLLKDNDLTASEVAYEVGFNNPSYFNTCFHEYYGFPPGEIKKNGDKITPLLIKENKEEQIPDERISKKAKSAGILNIVIGVMLLSIVAYFIVTSLKKVEKSLAVLPLYNLTGDTSNDYFVDGMHDELIGELGKISSLRVISRTSTLKYRDKDMLLKDIADELGVNIIVEGSVMGAGDSIRLLIQVIDVEPKERHLLANEYRDDMNNVLKVHALAANDISQKINIKFSNDERQQLNEEPTVNPEIYKLYLRGMYYLNKGNKASFEKGMKYLHEAIDKDPGDPFAYGALALGYATKGHGQIKTEEAFNRAVSAAKKAIKIDPTIDDAHTALAILYTDRAWDWQNAKQSYENALSINPSNAMAHSNFAWYHVLFEDLEKAKYHAEQAVILEPLSPTFGVWLALIYFNNNEYDKAEECVKKAMKLNENIPYANLALGWICLERMQYDKAIEYHEKLPKWIYFKVQLGYAYLEVGQKEKALELWKVVNNKPNVNPCIKGMMAGYLGFTDLAFELLDEAYQKKEYPVAYINWYPCTKPIRNDPRFIELLKKMNLPHREHHLASN
jgi:TolB-like protein/AraC-like DNA-binding protein